MDYLEVKDWLEAHAHKTFNTKDEQFTKMYDILKLHKNYKNWKFKEPERFRITRAQRKKSIQVYVKFKNKKRERLVSWVSCTSKTPPKIDKLTLAMRKSIHSQILDWRESHAVRKCEICDSYNNIEVDHYPTKFVDIKKIFLNGHEENPTKFFWNPKNGKYYFLNKDLQFENDWQIFHQSLSQFRYLCQSCNQRNK